MITRHLTKSAFRAIVLAAALCSASPAHAANLILDGDFVNTNATYAPIASPGTIGPWTVNTGSVDLIGGYWQSPSAVVNGGSVDLDGTAPNVPGGIQQIFTAGPGNYVLSFDLSGNPDGSPTTKMLQVSVGSVTEDFTYTTGSNTHSNMLYVPETVDFTSAGGPVTLSFLSQDVDSSFGPVIGDVSVSETPLPAAFTLFASVLAGFVALMWSRARRATA